jgi:hypothetical protein
MSIILVNCGTRFEEVRCPLVLTLDLVEMEEISIIA